MNGYTGPERRKGFSVLTVLKIMAFVIFVNLILSIGTEIQFQQRSDRLEQFKQTVKTANDNSNETNSLLNGILNTLKSNSTAQSQAATAAAVASISRIEQKLCNGPCPLVTIPPTTSTTSPPGKG